MLKPTFSLRVSHQSEFPQQKAHQSTIRASEPIYSGDSRLSRTTRGPELGLGWGERGGGVRLKIRGWGSCGIKAADSKVARQMQLTARLRAVIAFSPERFRALTKLRWQHSLQDQTFHWSFFYFLFTLFLQCYLSPNPYLCKWAAACSRTHKKPLRLWY